MVKSLQDLAMIKEEAQKIIKYRTDKNLPFQGKYQVLICSGTGCSSSGSLKVIDGLMKYVRENNIEDKVLISKTGCFGFCKLGPIVLVYPDRTFYVNVTIDDTKEIVESHFINNKPVERLLYKSPGTGKIQKTIDEIEFFHDQMRIALRNCGVINPESIEEYIGCDGYFGLYNCIHNKKREEVIDIIEKSGLRGRGGAGFPTGKKWRFVYNSSGDEKYVICNADEGDPGAFMDRSILEGDPHSIIEAMSIAGYAIGARQGYIYVRAEYPIAVDRLEKALTSARKHGILGENIFNSEFTFDIEIRIGAGAFVCGEETALISSASGKRGEPKPRPPFPATSGIWNKPTLINNVETLSNIPIIIRNGSDWYSKIGTEKSKGTKVFAIAGKINNTGLIEVPMGTTLRDIVFKIGGGIPENREIKAVQTGGPSGGCIPEKLMDTPIDYESLQKVGSMMGSGGMIVLDETDCMIDIARFYLEFTQDESCGKCPPCRIGTKRLLERLIKITEGEGKQEDIEFLQKFGETIKNSSICGLGQSAPNPILSTIKYFRDEYDEHINKGYCRAGTCRSLMKYVISDEKCVACGICAKICPVTAISGKIKQPPFQIHQDICIKCGACEEKCPVDAIYKR